MLYSDYQTLEKMKTQVWERAVKKNKKMQKIILKVYHKIMRLSMLCPTPPHGTRSGLVGDLSVKTMNIKIH